MESLDLIVKMRFGSHLYGTATPDSDEDWKGVFMPSAGEVLLGRIPKSCSSKTKKGCDAKNTADDVDTEMYSLHYFIELACQGQTVALDMLHAPRGMCAVRTPLWERIVTERHRFHTRNLQAFVGYARKQASKYGIKGSRLSAVADAIRFLKSWPADTKLAALWEELPVDEHRRKPGRDPNGARIYEVCGRKFPEGAKADYVLPVLEKYHRDYGERARMAARNEGIDWKAVSHALRAAFQTREILTEGAITFPLREAPYLLKVKRGELDYSREVALRLETLMDEVESLSAVSGLPDEVDRGYWDDFVMEAVESACFFGHYGDGRVY